MCVNLQKNWILHFLQFNFLSIFIRLSGIFSKPLESSPQGHKRHYTMAPTDWVVLLMMSRPTFMCKSGGVLLQGLLIHLALAHLCLAFISPSFFNCTFNCPMCCTLHWTCSTDTRVIVRHASLVSPSLTHPDICDVGADDEVWQHP